MPSFRRAGLRASGLGIRVSTRAPWRRARSPTPTAKPASMGAALNLEARARPKKAPANTASRLRPPSESRTTNKKERLLKKVSIASVGVEVGQLDVEDGEGGE